MIYMFIIGFFFFAINQICARNGVGVVRVRPCVRKRLIIIITTRLQGRRRHTSGAIGKLVAGGRLLYFG